MSGRVFRKCNFDYEECDPQYDGENALHFVISKNWSAGTWTNGSGRWSAAGG
jgi:hypothetical protein